MHPMFDLQPAGWLRFRPFMRYELPTPYHCHTSNADKADEVPFTDKRTGKVVFRRKLWHLRWPGETELAWQTLVPAAIVERWPAWEEEPGRDQSHYTIGEILTNGWLPPDGEIPEVLAYFLAINYRHLGIGGVPYGICGLPAARVQEVLDARFTLDHEAHAALQYLKWMAEGHRDHPLLRPFDTSVRDTLCELNHKMVELYFYLLSDYLYDAETQWWARINKPLWQPMATYLHWVGRTGSGLYDWLSGFRQHNWASKMLHEAPDLQAALEAYNGGAMYKMRNYSHAKGDPCQADPDNPPTGPSLGEE